MTIRHDGITAEWLGYATLRLEANGTVVYLDPGRYGVLTGEWEYEPDHGGHPPSRDYAPHDGDIVCVSHIHHYDPDGIRRVARDDATVVAFEGINVHATDREIDRLVDLDYDLRRVSMESECLVDGVPIWTTAAYNRQDGPNLNDDGEPIHPKGIGCGFLVALDETRVFWPGDSDVLPGHAELDVSLFVPSIAQNYTMDRHDAADLAAEMDPDLVVPIHYNTFESLAADSGAFAEDVAQRGVPVVLDEGSV
jgi:L-ascorbate metabolism protein UlaG (beta-lactamase superfamily)